jgi:DNA repair exonuclease SbcCD ATPase subunit
MSIDIVNRCAICEADFRPGTLDEDGKCSSCRVKFPTVKSKQEAMALNRPDINLGDKLTDEKIRQIIREELNAFKAELNAFKAEQKVERMAQARAAKQDKKNDESEGDK